MAKVSKPTTILGVAKLKKFAIFAFKSRKIALLNSKTIEGDSLSVYT